MLINIEDIHNSDSIDSIFCSDDLIYEEKDLFMHENSPQLKDITNRRDENEDEYATEEEDAKGIKNLQFILINKKNTS